MLYKMKQIFYLILVIFLASCTKEIPVDLPLPTNKIVVNCMFNPDSLWSVHLVSSVPTSTDTCFSLGEYPTIDSAIVKISSNGTLIEQLQYVNKGNYRSYTNKPQAGQIYEIRVNANGFGPVSAVDTVPFTTNFTIKSGGSMLNDFGQTTPIYDIKIENKPTESFFFKTFISEYKEWYNDYYDTTIQRQSYNEPTFIQKNIKMITRAYGQCLFSNKSWASDSISLSFINDYASIGTNDLYLTRKLYVGIASYSYYEYYRTLAKLTSDNFFSPPASVYSNIKGGYGIFAAYNNGTPLVFNEYKKP